MAICPNCGTSNPAGSTRCTQCGQPLEVIPNWLELLLARYGEAMPAFEGISAERASAVAPTKPFVAQRPAPEQPQPSREVAPEDVELLEELERLKQLSGSEQPASAETPPSAETSAAAAPSTAPKEVDDWLAELRALQEKAALDAAPAMPSEERPPETAPQVSREPHPERETSPSLESLVEAAPTPPAETPLPSLEERLSALTSPAETAETEEGTPAQSVPEWLQELGLVQAEQAPAPPSGESGELGETLGPLPVVEAERPGEAGEVSADEDIPDWLRRLIAISSQTPEAPPAGEEAEPTQALVRSEPEAPPAAELTAEEELPDWLRELEAAQTARLSTPTAPAASEVIPPRVDEAAKAATGVPETVVPPLPQAAEAGVPAVQQEEGSPAGAEEQTADWLAELEALVERPPVAPPPPPPAEEEEVPDWLRELTAEKPAAERAVQAPAVPEVPQPEAAPLPEWVSRLRPTELTAEAPSVEAAAVPPEASAAPSGEDVIETLRARLGVPQVPDVEGAEMFREIVGEPAEMASTPVPEEVEMAPRRSLASVIIWALIFAALLLGIAILSLAVLTRIQELLGATAFQRFLNTPAAAGLLASLEGFRKPVTAIHPGEVVLLSIDYTPATAAEMQPLASVVLRDLLAQRARVLTVSLQPEGAPLAQQLLEGVAGTYPYGEATLNLGYLPGEAIGVRSLAHLRTRPVYGWPHAPCRSLGECPGWKDVQRIEDIALFITVADSAESARWWIEQLPRMSSGALPMLAAVSAAALPTMRPYLISAAAAPSRLTGLIGGMMMAATYEVYTGSPGRALDMVAAQSAAHLGLVAVALAGIFAGIRARTP
ncbi:MAG: hypothetical protein DDG58_08875 [Ardenticatenia bacterium]|nr:MAG: hypothetical protein DDG58_08875 [Ardenticatenia bacterium]